MHWGERSARWVTANWFKFSSLIGSILLAAAGAPTLIAAEGHSDSAGEYSLFGAWGLGQYLFAIGAGFVIAGVIGQVCLRPSYAELLVQRNEAQSISLDRASAIESVLRAILTSLSKALGTDGPGFRASVYCFVDSDFVLLSRTSANPVLKQRGRASYPAGQGVIGKVWTETKAVVTGLPEDRAEWEARLVEEGMPAETAAALRMHSRSIIGARIDARLPGGLESIGVIIIESLGNRGVNARTLDRLLGDQGWLTLQHAMANARDHFPAVAAALTQPSD